MRALCLAAVVSLSAISCSKQDITRVDLSKASWHWSNPDSSSSFQIPARVPGHVLESLVQSGLAPNPNQGTHERDVQWVESEPWTLSTHVNLSKGLMPGDSAELHFEGLDTYAAVHVNDVCVLKANNAHRSWTTHPFLVTEEGLDIDILFDPVAERGQESLDAQGMLIPASNEARPIGFQTSPMTRKPGYQFGWDWGPRLAGPGVSGQISLHCANSSKRTIETSPVCKQLEVNERLARVLVQNHEGWHLDIAREDHAVDWAWVEDEVHIVNPAMWWPADMGDQPLYEWTWTHLHSGTVRRQTMGIRTLHWTENEDEWGTTFQLTLNGLSVHAKGANVIPPDFHQTKDADRWIKLVEQARAANMNMVRVWGGGVYPPNAFFDACDRAGLLVWQDFMFACTMVPDDEDFFENVRLEAQEQVQRIAHHPCLALWCGNNEVERAWTSWGWQETYGLREEDSLRLENAYKKLFHEVLPDIVNEGSDTYYLPTSPTLDEKSGDEHAWGVWFGLEDFGYYGNHGGRFVSEYGLQSLPDIHTLLEAGIEAFDDDALQFRQRSSMEWLEPGFDGWDMMHHFMSKTTGAPLPNNLVDWIFKSQWTHAEGIRQALEQHRTSHGRYSGSLFWSLNDVWPGVSWSTVDHSGRWKLAHYAARRANAPLTALWCRQDRDSLRFDLFNAFPKPFQGKLHVAVKDFNGEPFNQTEISISLDPRSDDSVNLGNMVVWNVQPLDSYLSWQLTDDDGHVVVNSTALWCAPVLAHLPEPQIQCLETKEGFQLQSDVYTPVVQMTSNVPGHWSDNGMSLEPNQICVVQFEPDSKDKIILEVCARGGNTPPQ